MRSDKFGGNRALASGRLLRYDQAMNPTRQGPIHYEVSLSIENGIADAYRDWLESHIRELLRIEGFEKAELEQLHAPVPDPGMTELRVRYTLSSQEAFEAYLKEHAPEMRRQAVERFGDRFKASRAVYQSRKIYNNIS